jgi:hypothetical protein
MPLDHYVSQVHLKNFYSPALNGLMYAIRKADMKRFQTRAQAGFAAYVASCAPAAMRIHTAPMKTALESVAAILDARGGIPNAPKSLGGKSLTELLGEGTVKFDVDPKYPQALGINSIKQRTSIFGNSQWDVLRTGEEGLAFFTSDYPVAIETAELNTPINRIVPLAPDVAIRICPDAALSRAKPEFTFPKFKAVRRNLKRAEVADINRIVVRCAEELVFFRDDRQWIEGFVGNNREYRIEPVTEVIRTATGCINMSTQRVLARSTC